MKNPKTRDGAGKGVGGKTLWGSLAPRVAATALLATLAGCADDAPLFYPVFLQYRGPAPGSIPPATILDGSCYHHNAPVNLLVATSWGAQGRLEQTGPDTYGLGFSAAPVDQDLWVAFLDITLCPTGGSLWVTRGVTANRIALSHAEVVDGRARLTFRIDRSGRVVP